MHACMQMRELKQQQLQEQQRQHGGPANTFWMIPSAVSEVGGSNNQQHPIWALSSTVTPVFNMAARPVSSFMAATNISSGVEASPASCSNASSQK